MIDIIYLRTSTEEQNPENQLADIKSVLPLGVNPRIFREQQSAWMDNPNKRKDFREVLKIIRDGEARSFNVWDLDRVYRNRMATVEFIRLCKAKNVIVRSYRQEWLQEFEKMPKPWDEIMHQFIVNVFGWIAEEESNKKSERVKAAHKNHQGKKWGRPSMPEETVKEISHLLNQGLSYRQIQSKVTYRTYEEKRLRHPSLAKITALARSQKHHAISDVHSVEKYS